MTGAQDESFEIKHKEKNRIGGRKIEIEPIEFDTENEMEKRGHTNHRPNLKSYPQSTVALTDNMPT